MSIPGNRLLSASAAALMLTALDASAVTISWYEQRAPGHAAGEVRITELAEGEFEFETPGRGLEVGIARHGDIAVVILDDGGRPAKSGSLLLVARQGGRTVRAAYPLAMPAQAEPTDPVRAASDAAGGVSAASGQSPTTARVAGTAPETGAATIGAAGAAVRPGTPVLLPAAAAPSPDGEGRKGGTGLPDLAAAVPGLSPGNTACRVLLLRTGSLRDNLGRLVRECGARMGRWNTSSSPEWLVDWKVPAPELLARDNGEGLPGLLRLLEERFGLAGVPDPDRPDAIDFYRLRTDPYPSGRAAGDLETP